MITLRTVTILFSLLLRAAAVAQTHVVVDPDSRIWIEGSSTVNEFTCIGDEIDGHATLERGRPEAELVIAVETFDCGKSRMNRDFYEALKSETYPHIVFELTDARLASSDNGTFEVTVRGDLTIAGVTRPATLIAEGRKQRDGEYRVMGRLPLSMLDFDIKPPTAFAGLIKAHDRIVVGFDIVTKVEETATAGVCSAEAGAIC